MDMEANNDIVHRSTLPKASISNQTLSISSPLSMKDDNHLLDHDQVALNIDWVSLLCGGRVQNTHQCGGGDHGQEVVVDGGTASGGPSGGGGGGRSTKPGRGLKRKKTAPPRFVFHTRSAEDVLDDGYKWRKYGQKAVKNSIHPRSYYRCTYHTCIVKKQIQRLSGDRSIVVTTYDGIHNHPCEKVMETLAPLLKQLHFLSRF
ncbi:WRKY Transcription Factor [Dionaea muscipula]